MCARLVPMPIKLYLYDSKGTVFGASVPSGDIVFLYGL